MPRQRTAGTIASSPIRPITAPIVRVKTLEDAIKKSVTTSMKDRLGLKANQSLPAEVQTLIQTAAKTAAESSLELAVVRDVEEIAADTARGAVLNRFDAKVSVAQKGLAHISKSDDVQKILKQRAEMLAAKKKALETAGFSRQEAMEILLADIAARAH